jgi:predicted enzyme involved in methoxymalonyl-ACP biosynthesis
MDDIKGKIRKLEESVQMIEKQITTLIESDDSDVLRIKSLEEKKSQYNAEIRRLNKLSWEETHERVDFDDR